MDAKAVVAWLRDAGPVEVCQVLDHIISDPDLCEVAQLLCCRLMCGDSVGVMEGACSSIRNHLGSNEKRADLARRLLMPGDHEVLLDGVSALEECRKRSLWLDFVSERVRKTRTMDKGVAACLQAVGEACQSSRRDVAQEGTVSLANLVSGVLRLCEQQRLSKIRCTLIERRRKSIDAMLQEVGELEQRRLDTEKQLQCSREELKAEMTRFKTYREVCSVQLQRMEHIENKVLGKVLAVESRFNAASQRLRDSAMALDYLEAAYEGTQDRIAQAWHRIVQKWPQLACVQQFVSSAPCKVMPSGGKPLSRRPGT